MSGFISEHCIEDLESKVELLWWQKKGLSYTASGYGSKIPTSRMVKLPGDKRWRRVYCTVFSNAGTCWVQTKNGRVLIR